MSRPQLVHSVFPAREAADMVWSVEADEREEQAVEKESSSSDEL